MSTVLDLETKHNESVSTAEHKRTCYTCSVLFSIWVICSLYLICAAGSLKKLPSRSIDETFCFREAVCSSWMPFSVQWRLKLHVSLTTSRPLTHAEWKLTWVALTLHIDTPPAQLKIVAMLPSRVLRFYDVLRFRRVLATKSASS